MKQIGMALLSVGLWASTALAQDMATSVETRQADMKAMAASFGIIGDMVRGKVDYDAASAQAAADKLVEIAGQDWAALFPEGSSIEDFPKSEALPKLWTDWDDFLSGQTELETAAADLQAVAGQGKDGLRPAVMGIAKACSGCHTPFRATK